MAPEILAKYRREITALRARTKTRGPVTNDHQRAQVHQALARAARLDVERRELRKGR